MPQLLSTQINSRQRLKSVKKKAVLHDYVQNSQGRPSRQTWRDRAPLTPDFREGAHTLGIHHSTQHPGLQKPSINTLIVRAEVNLSAPLAHGLITSWNAGGCGSSEINKSRFCSCQLHWDVLEMDTCSRYMGRKYIRAYACSWLDLMENWVGQWTRPEFIILASI